MNMQLEEVIELVIKSDISDRDKIAIVDYIDNLYNDKQYYKERLEEADSLEDRRYDRSEYSCGC